MTMPHLMNCSHQDEGWCLDCVGELEQMNADLREQNTELDAACAKLEAANAELMGALRISEQFMSIASDWNIDEAEINGEMQSTYYWLEIVRAAIAKHGGANDSQ